MSFNALIVDKDAFEEAPKITKYLDDKGKNRKRQAQTRHQSFSDKV